MGTESEKLAAMAAQIASMDSQLADLKNALLRMDTKLDAWQSTYVPRAEINEMFRSRDEKIEHLQSLIETEREEKITHKQVLPIWVQAALALAATGISLYSIFRP